MRTVHLTPTQVAVAQEVADVVHRRYSEEVKSRFGADRGVPPVRTFFCAYCAELALSLAIGEAWHRGDVLENVMGRKADVGDINEARWTGSRQPELRVYDPTEERSQDRGHMDRRFWLITGFPPDMRIHGWMLGSDVVRLGERRRNREGHHSYYVPAIEIPPWPTDHLGWALGAIRTCPSCRADHPVGTTCAEGWAPA